jgi:hypothetical protein
MDETATEAVSMEPNSAEDSKIITIRTPLIEALQWAERRATWVHRTRIDVMSYMSAIYPAIRILNYDKIALGEITYQHIDNILTQAYKCTSKYHTKKKKMVERKWSNYQKNRAKQYFSTYFGIMKEKMVIKDNPCAGKKALPWKKKKENAYTEIELQEIIRLLLAADPDYTIFMILFYDSGARETEFMKLRDTDVDLTNQVFKREILKGLHNKDTDDEDPEGIISDAALPYWRKVLERCKPGDYLFGRGFRPGKKPIRPDRINARWRAIVKPHFPESRPYLMKHSNLTSITDHFGDTMAAAAAGHTSTEMIKKHYDKRRRQRAHEVLKKKSNIQLLGAPELLPSPLPPSGPCIPVAVASLAPAPARRVPCPPCHLPTLAPSRPYHPLQAA